ncbi:hypothetical protein [Methanocella conradii]|uniref:hypothetical protein n=1 Tax=Methanocella conradii TaxID=1175444 RepID=UPI0020C6685A|nr:hypothetical protein [Methanocella conradii]
MMNGLKLGFSTLSIFMKPPETWAKIALGKRGYGAENPRRFNGGMDPPLVLRHNIIIFSASIDQVYK